MFDSKVPTGPAEAGHDFIGDRQHVMLSAHFCYLLKVIGRRNRGTQRCSAYRLEDEGGGRVPNPVENLVNFSCVSGGAVLASVNTPVTIRCVYLLIFPKHRLIDFTSTSV